VKDAGTKPKHTVRIPEDGVLAKKRKIDLKEGREKGRWDEGEEEGMKGKRKG